LEPKVTLSHLPLAPAIAPPTALADDAGRNSSPALRFGVTFRPRGRHDGADLLELFNEDRFLRDASVTEPFASPQALEKWLGGIAATERFEAVAVHQAKVVGFCGLYKLGDQLSHTGWLMLGVRESMQRRGIGSRLLQIVIAAARIAVNIRRVQLTVLRDNTAAIQLYRKFDFEFEGLHRHFVRRGDDFVDAFTMARIFDDYLAAPGEFARPAPFGLPVFTAPIGKTEGRVGVAPRVRAAGIR
jgi:L-phenylalanine/L-methionine N-acetyltransferase